jgi:propane monooxygenase coupling protein
MADTTGTVGISLMASVETEAAIAFLRETAPDAMVSFRDCFYKIERPGLLEFDMEAIGEHLGRQFDTDLFLVNMSTYYGRMVVEPGKVRIHTEIQPDRFKEP